MKGQAATEFIIVIGIAILIILTLLSFVADDMKSLQDRKESAAIKDVGFMIQNELFTAAYVQDGYYRKFEIPDTVNSVRYTFAVSNNYLSVKSTELGLIQEFPIPEFTGNLQFGTNTLNKVGGEIHLN